MSEKNEKDNSIRINPNHLWNGLWAAVLLVLGLGINGMIDERISNHPRVVETTQLVKENRAVIQKIDKTVGKLEVILERNEKLLEELLTTARNQ